MTKLEIEYYQHYAELIEEWEMHNTNLKGEEQRLFNLRNVN